MSEAKQLLFTNSAGVEAPLSDIMSEGLEFDFGARVPALERLLNTGSPYERLVACALLAAWGNERGLQQLVLWCEGPDNPWSGRTEPIAPHRVTEVETAPQLLAEALSVSVKHERTPARSSSWTRAFRAMLAHYSQWFFDNTLAYALGADLETARSLTDDIEAAASAAVESTDGPRPRFDLATQAAALLGILVRFGREKRAVELAQKLVARHPENRTMLFEIARSFGRGALEASLDLLGVLARSSFTQVAQAAEQAIRRREKSNE